MPNILGLEAIKLLKKWKLGEFRVERGWWWYPTDTIHNVYRGTMLYLWDKKQKSQNPAERAICTRIYSSLWGISHQYLADKEELGKYANTLIGYTVEENSRLHVAETCLEQGITPLAVVGDGFIHDAELTLNLSKDLGKWKLSKQGKCLIAGSGAIAFENNEKPQGLALHYNTLIQQMNKNPNQSKYTRDKYSPVTLALSLQTNFNKLGMIQKIHRSLMIGYNFEREFLERPQTGKDLSSEKIEKIWNSIPWDYNVLTTINKIPVETQATR